MWSESIQFLRDYCGKDNRFAKTLEENHPNEYNYQQTRLMIIHILQRFRSYVENNLLKGLTPERQAQIDVVSDILGQAQNLLREKDKHPAAPTMIIGAALNEFLRNWVEEKQLSLEGKKPGIENYIHILQKNELIDKQDHKDITSWAGMRNDAAHVYWDKVEDRNKIELMLQGVNYFIRKKTER